MHESVGASQGDEFDLGMGNIAHGGYCVARLDGRVVFVRGALPGEEVRVRLTDISKASHWFGQAVDVICKVACQSIACSQRFSTQY